MEVRQNFLECEEHRGQWSVERGSNRGCRSDRNQRANVILAEAKPASGYRRNSRADVDGGSFTSKGNAAAERDRGADEFSDDGAKANVTVAQNQCDARL